MMKSRPRKRLTLDQRRAKILAAATRLFAREGYEGASMSAIASAAGTTKPVLYDHFNSKDALFETLLCSIRDDLLAQGRVIGRSAASDGARFCAAVDAFFAFVEAQPDEARILLIVPQGDPAAAKLSREVQRGATSGIAELLKPRFPGGGGWEAEAAGECLKEALHTLAKWWLGHPGPPRAAIVELVVKMCWTGLKEVGDEGRRHALS